MAGEHTGLLGDVAELIRGVSYRPTELQPDGIDAIPLLRATNIGSRTLDLSEVLFVPPTLVRESQLLRRFDVVIAMSSGSRQAVGRLAQLRDDWVGCVGAFCGVIRPDPDRVEPQYLGYVLQSPAFRTRIETYAVGTAIMNLSRERLLGYPLTLPNRRIQRAIAHILGTLDNKIELNRRMNETLEAMARALFKSWFVDFDPVRAKTEGRDPGLPQSLAGLFPTRFVDSALGKIPEGWTPMGLDEIARFVNGLALQKYPPSEEGSIPVIKIAQLRSGNTERADAASADLDADFIVEDGDVLFSWSGSLECVLWAGGRGALNQHLFRVTSPTYPKWFYYSWIREHLEAFREVAAGKATTMGHIQRRHLSDAKAIVPSSAVLSALDPAIGPLVESIWRRDVQSRTLAAIRDALLPNLISGEIRLGDAERWLEAAPV